MSIHGFEEETARLTTLERETILPAVVKILSERIGEEMCVPASDIRRMLVGVLTYSVACSVHGSRLRKIINVIRRECHVPWLIASNNGYWVAGSHEELLAYIRALRKRAKAIDVVADYLYKQSCGRTQVRAL